MKIFKKLKKFFIHFLGLDNFSFENISLTKKCIEQIQAYAIESHPYESFGLLRGRVKDNTLLITSVIFIPHISEKDNVVTRPFSGSKEWGTMHSHPSGSIRPSIQDLKTFSKNPVNIIIGYPYYKNNIALYNHNGIRLEFSVMDIPFL